MIENGANVMLKDKFDQVVPPLLLDRNSQADVHFDSTLTLCSVSTGLNPSTLFDFPDSRAPFQTCVAYAKGSQARQIIRNEQLKITKTDETVAAIEDVTQRIDAIEERLTKIAVSEKRCKGSKRMGRRRTQPLNATAEVTSVFPSAGNRNEALSGRRLATQETRRKVGSTEKDAR